MSMEQNVTQAGGRTPRRRAGAFDVRTIIGLLLGIYGVVLGITGLVATSGQDLAKAGDINLNLWTAVGLLLASAVFFVWARLRPILMPADFDMSSSDDETH
jgi:LPXTG-motif cell wall-anchored protein